MKLIAFVICLAFSVWVLPLLAGHDPYLTQPENILAPPSYDHPLGTDHLGRDVWSRVVSGIRLTVYMGAVSTALAMASGILLGLWWGIGGTLTGRVFPIIINAVLAIPQLIVALVIITLLDKGVNSLAFAVGLSQLPFVIRVIRGAVLAVNQSDYVRASLAFGATRTHLIRAHILPNIHTTMTAYGAITFAYSILQAAGLGFLGLIGKPGIPELGAMMFEGQVSFRLAPWVVLSPGIALFILVYAANRLASGYARFKP